MGQLALGWLASEGPHQMLPGREGREKVVKLVAKAGFLEK